MANFRLTGSYSWVFTVLLELQLYLCFCVILFILIGVPFQILSAGTVYHGQSISTGPQDPDHIW